MEPADWAEDELSRTLRAWEGDADDLQCRAGTALGGGLDYGAFPLGTATASGVRASHSTGSLHNLAVIGNTDDTYQNINNNADVNDPFSGWRPKYPDYEEVDPTPEEEALTLMRDVTKKVQVYKSSPQAGNNVFPLSDDIGAPSDDRDSVAAAVDSVKTEAIDGARDSLNQGMRRLLDRATNTGSAMKRGVRRVREIVSIACRHARYTRALTGRDTEVFEPLLEDDAYAGQEDSGRRSLSEFLQADKRLFR